MPEEDFLQKLRMNNIFPPNGGPLQGTPFGMPDLNAGTPDINHIFNLIQQNKDLDMQRKLNYDNQTHLRQPSQGLSNIAQSSMSPEQPQNTIWGYDSQKKTPVQPITPYQRESLDIEKERLKQTGKLGEERLETTKRGQDISKQRADVYKFKAENPNMRIITPKGGNVMAIDPITGEVTDLGIDAGTLTDEERINLQGTKAMERVNAVTNRQKELQKSKGEQTQQEIATRESNIRGRDKATNVTKTGQQVNAQQIINTRPDLAKYIKVTSDGLVQIDPNTPLNELSMIQNILYPKTGQNKDINLPASTKSTPNKTPVSVTPKSTTPTAAELIKKYGG